MMLVGWKIQKSMVKIVFLFIIIMSCSLAYNNMVAYSNDCISNLFKIILFNIKYVLIYAFFHPNLH